MFLTGKIAEKKETVIMTSESDLITKTESKKSQQFSDEVKKTEVESLAIKVTIEDSVRENETLEEELVASGSSAYVEMNIGETKKEKREFLVDNLGECEGEHSKSVNEAIFANDNIHERRVENEMTEETVDGFENVETSSSNGVKEAPTSESFGQNEGRKPNMKHTTSRNLTSFTIDLSLSIKIGWRNRPSMKIRPNFQFVLK